MNPDAPGSPLPDWVTTLRATLPVTERCIYLQTGTKGPLSRPTLQALHDAELLSAQEGPAAPRAKSPLLQASEAARSALAQLLHTSTRQLCWSLNTSTAMRSVLHSLRPGAADLLVTTDLEHVATRSLCAGLRDACGLRTQILAVGDQDEAFLARLEQALRTAEAPRKIVLLSHVSCIDGRRLPVAAAVACARKWGAISVIDGAQAVGQFSVDLAALDADYYIASGHKWLQGPAGLGFIQVHADRLGDFNPNWLPTADRADATAAALGEAGSVGYAPPAGLRVALEQVLAIGCDAIETHVAHLRQRLCAGLAQLPGFTVHGPREAARTTGLVSFSHAQWDAATHQRLVEDLYLRPRILCKFQPETAGLRVALAAFNTSEEVDALLHALRQAQPAGKLASAPPRDADQP